MPKKEVIKSLKFLLASPDDILAWSYGEVTKPETINYRTARPYMDGLMSEQIFGPVRDYECYCGKYRRAKYAGIICDKCGVEVTSSKVRRERMGHIRLAAPVVHIWYAYGTPNKLSIILDIPYKKLVSVIYYTMYVVVEVNEEAREKAKARLEELADKLIKEAKGELEQRKQELVDELKVIEKKLASGKNIPTKLAMQLQAEKEKLSKQMAILSKEDDSQIEELQERLAQAKSLVESITYKSTLTEEQYQLLEEYDLVFFKAMMGAEAIERLLSDLDIDAELKRLNEQYNLAKATERLNIERKIKYLSGFKKNNLKPEWMVLKVLPVLPADLRPIIQLAGGRFASSDLNDLYRRVVNRNNRLKELQAIGAPEVVIRNEKRMLQEAVDALLDNQHRFSAPVTTRTGVPLKSLAELLRGKQGRFRRNLLGKRVDFSGRAVITPDKTLALNECGIPKSLALEVYKPFVLRGLVEAGYALTITEAKELFEKKAEVVWDILEEVIKDKVVLLNRPPSLHKYSIQAFYPKLVDGSAIRINHLITEGYNADFDGDQMGVFALITEEALKEAKERMLPIHNLIKAATGEPIAKFKNDLVVGIYYLTYMDEPQDEKKVRYIGDPYRAISMYYEGHLGLQEPILTIAKGQKVLTTPGRLIFNKYTPEGLGFINKTIDSKELNKIVRDITLHYDKYTVQEFLDNMKLIILSFATESGFSLGYQDLITPEKRDEIINETMKKQLKIEQQYQSGFITKEQRDEYVVQLWREAMETMKEEIWNSLSDENPLKQQVISGAKGSKDQLQQIVGFIGIVNDIQGHPVPQPIIGAYGLGLNPFEYSLAAIGGRKGMLDKALNTRNSGYLARKLVDVAQDAITRMEDCGYDGPGIPVSRNQIRVQSFKERILGRFLTQDVTNNKGEVIAKAGDIIDEELAKRIDESDVEQVWVRSPLVCRSPLGLCVKCYGYDFGKYDLVQLGAAVGVLAAQSVSEPTTQLTLRTFHTGGIGQDITMGFPYLQELIEMRTPKSPAIISPMRGTVHIKDGVMTIVGKKLKRTYYVVEDDYNVIVQDKQEVKKGEVLFETSGGAQVIAPFDASVTIEGNVLFLTGEVDSVMRYKLKEGVTLHVKDGDTVEPGDILTGGKIDFKELAEYKDHLEVELELLNRIQEVYKQFKISVKDIHLEVLIRQMGKLAKVIHPGDTGLVRGSFVSKYMLDLRNKLLKEQGKKPVVYIPKLMGITAVALNTDSVLSAMSFQEQPKVLSEAAILGRTDYLRGLKENVIIGHLLPLNERAIIHDVTKLEELNE